MALHVSVSRICVLKSGAERQCEQMRAPVLCTDNASIHCDRSSIRIGMKSILLRDEPEGPVFVMHILLP